MWGEAMSIEAMKQALEALEDARLHIFLGDKNGVEANIRAHKQCESLRQAIAEAENQVSYSGNGTAGRENMTAPTGFFFQMPKQEPIARVTGVYGGRFIVEPINPAMVLPTNMALYAEPQPKAEKQEPVGEIYGWHGKSQSLCRWFVPEKNLPAGTKLYVAHPEPELNPVAWGVHDQIALNKTLENHPQPKTQAQRAAWVGLTDEQIDALAKTVFEEYMNDINKVYDRLFAKAVEAKLKEKNT